MTHDLYEMKLHPKAQKTMEELLEKLHTKGGMGVTHMGNRLTVRWGSGNLRSVHLLILEVDDGRPEEQCPSCGGEFILSKETGLCNRGDCDK